MKPETNSVLLNNKVVVILPAFNESENLPKIIPELSKRNISIILVDDGSDDKTSEIARTYGVSVVRHEKKLGKGKALRSGLQYALAQDFEWIGFMDADGQHRVEDFEKLLYTAFSQSADLIIGERFFSKKMPLIRRWTNQFMTFILRKMTGLQVNDTQCGLKIFSRNSAERIKLKEDHFEIESEIIINAANLHLKTISIPISTTYISGRSSRISPILDTMRWIQFIYRILCHKIII